MERAQVFFTDFRGQSDGCGILEKLKALLFGAGLSRLELSGRYAAIKLHFGERGNLAFLRPNYARAVAEAVKELGGKPFLTDCNTLYAGYRKDALEHLETAAVNGFSELSTGCQILIGDGLKGDDEVELPVPGGCHFQRAKIGRVLADADVLISLTHFKGHEKMGIGGAVKNIGMGCASRAGKMELHSDGKPELSGSLCIGCGRCQSVCAHGALSRRGRKMRIDHARCVGCGRCLVVCPRDALMPSWGGQSNRLLCEKTVEYAAAVLAGKPSLHINILQDISPECDCHDFNDLPMLPDLGMLASFDPVALDVASADLCNAAAGRSGGQDLFDSVHEDTCWRAAIEHAVRIGLGSSEYDLVKL